MTLPNEFLLTNLLRHRIRCDQGIDHGIGFKAWMHPPVHRLLGWVSRPSSFKLKRDVWRLDQLRGIGSQELFVKGTPVSSDQMTVERIPTLLEADILNLNGEKLGSIADFVFQPKTGSILYYLISRSDPRIPGTSRWRLTINRIMDQQPGMVSTNVESLEDLPLARVSLREDFLKKSRNLKDQLNEISKNTTFKLEGWLEDPPWDQSSDRSFTSNDSSFSDPLDDWPDGIDDETTDYSYSDKPMISSKGFSFDEAEEEDPWV